MNKLADSPAFPVSDSAVHALGLTKREFFAGLAMQGLLANGGEEFSSDPECHKEMTEWTDFASGAVQMADALLAELAKTTSKSC